MGIYLGASAIAEVIADIFLCPLEATRVRLVSNPSFADGLCSAAIRVFKEEGLLKGFYSGYGPTLLKQLPFTMAKFTVQGFAAEAMASTFDKSVSELQGGTQWGVSFLSGAVAGVAAAIISHPVDTLLSKVNKVSTTTEDSMMTRLSHLAREMGLIKLCTTGAPERCCWESVFLPPHQSTHSSSSVPFWCRNILALDRLRTELITKIYKTISIHDCVKVCSASQLRRRPK